MKKYLSISISLFNLLFIFYSCTSKDLSFSRQTLLSYSEKTFIISNHAKLTLQTPTLLKIHIPAYAFVNKFNQPVLDNIKIEVKEILRPDAMILGNMPTVSNGNLLESGGEFFIEATSGSEKLKLMPGVFIQLDLPNIGARMDYMQVFNGIKDTASGMIDWQPNNNSGNVIVRMGDSSTFNSNATYYSLFSDNLDWINVDKFISEPVFPFDVLPGNSPDIDSTSVYLHFSGRNSVIRMYRGAQAFSGSSIGGHITLVGICSKNGEIYSSISKMNFTAGQTATLNFFKTTDSELKQKLKALR